MHQLVIHYQTLSLPPPYSYVYTLKINLTASAPGVRLDWQYTERDELSEEEIWEEGFTSDDDFHWQGTLPEVWGSVLTQSLEQSQLNADTTSLTPDTALWLTVTDGQGRITTGTPRDLSYWEYLLQELVQGVYEVAQRELPLHIRYLAIPTTGPPVQATLTASFAYRRFTVTVEQDSPMPTRNLPWQQLRSLLEKMYIPDYHTDRAVSRLPQRPGWYLNPGDGWYELGRAITNPGKTDAVGQLRQTIESILLFT